MPGSTQRISVDSESATCACWSGGDLVRKKKVSKRRRTAVGVIQRAHGNNATAGTVNPASSLISRHAAVAAESIEAFLSSRVAAASAVLTAPPGNTQKPPKKRMERWRSSISTFTLPVSRTTRVVPAVRRSLRASSGVAEPVTIQNMPLVFAALSGTICSTSQCSRIFP